MISLARAAVVSFALLLGATFVMAQQDAEGAKDHPSFTRMSGYYISEFSEKDFDAEDFLIGENTVHVEGKTTRISYYSLKDDKYASLLQIVRNYQNAAKKAGGTILTEDCCRTVMKIAKPGHEVWVQVSAANDGYNYDVVVIEQRAMQQEVSAGALLDALNRDGHVALYINFDTGKSTIRPDSQPVINEVTALLRDNPALRLRIEGHTDDVGADAANQMLSEHRAAAVRQALVSAGIGAQRLTSAGFGEAKPIADNTTDAGRAKNRRVELVKVQ